MRHVDIKLPALSGGSANGYKGRFQLQLETGVTYKEIVMRLTNITPEQITRVKIVKDGDNLYDVSGEFLKSLQKYKDRYINDSWLVIPFADFEMLTQKAQNMTSLVTLPLENWFIKIETGEATDTQKNNNDVAQIDLRAVTTANPQWGRLYLPRMYEDTIPANRTGEIRSKAFVEQNKTGNSTAIRRAHLLSGAVEEFAILQDEKVVHEKDAILNKYDIEREEFKPQTFTNAEGQQESVYHFDPSKTRFGFVDKLITDAGSFEMRLKINKPRDIPVIYEVVEFVGNEQNVQTALATGYGAAW